MLYRAAAVLAVLLLSLSPLPAAEAPEGKAAYTITLSALPDRGLIGRRVDLVERRMSNNSARRDDVRTVLSDVLLLSSPEVNEWGAATRQATLALDPKEIKKLRKAEGRLGSDLLIRSRRL
jgi:hypothetical protein